MFNRAITFLIIGSMALLNLSACMSLPPSPSYRVFTPTIFLGRSIEASTLAPDHHGLLVLYSDSHHSQLFIGELIGTDSKIESNIQNSLAIKVDSRLLEGSKVIKVAPDNSIWILIRNNYLPLIHIVRSATSPKITTLLLGKEIRFSFLDNNTTFGIGSDNNAWVVTRMAIPSAWIAAYKVMPQPNAMNVYGPIPLGRPPIGNEVFLAPTPSGDMWVTIGLDGGSINKFGQTLPSLAYLSQNGSVIGRYFVGHLSCRDSSCFLASPQQFPAVQMRTIENGVEIAENTFGCMVNVEVPKKISYGSIWFLALIDTLSNEESSELKNILLKLNPTNPISIADIVASYGANLFLEEQKKDNFKLSSQQAKSFIKNHHYSKEAAHAIYIRLMNEVKNKNLQTDNMGNLNTHESCAYDPTIPGSTNIESGVMQWIRGEDGYWTLTKNSIYLQRLGYSVFGLERRLKNKHPGIFADPYTSYGTFLRAENIDPFDSHIFPLGKSKTWVISGGGRIISYVHLTNQVVVNTPNTYNELH